MVNSSTRDAITNIYSVVLLGDEESSPFLRSVDGMVVLVLESAGEKYDNRDQ